MNPILPITPGHAKQLQARGLDPVLAATLGVRSMPGREGAMALAFEYRVRGQLHNTKVRYGKGDMPWTETGKKLALWGIDDLAPPPRLNPQGKQDEAVIIVEGEMDRIALRQAGFSRVVSVPNGAPTREGSEGDKRYAYLYEGGSDRVHPDIAKFETVILAVDGDKPGMALRDDLAIRLGDEKCLWVKWPEGCKDANDVLLHKGRQALIDCIGGAKRMWLDLVSPISDIPEQPPEVGLEMGFDIFDDPIKAGGIRLPAHGFATIVGPAGSGKSVFARQLLWHLWRAHRLPFGITALEEPALPRYQRVFRRYATGLPYDQWTREALETADIEIDYACKIIQRPRGGLMFLDQLLGTVEFAIKVYGLKVICIDPMNEVEIDEANRSDVAARTAIMALKDLAERYRVLIMAVTHPPVDVMRRKKPTDLWTLYDVENGRHWAGKSDAGFGLWRPHPRGPTLINVAKLKSHEVFGEPNLFQMSYDRALDRYQCVRSGYDILAQVTLDLQAGTYDQQQPTPLRPKPSPTYSSYQYDN
jgi:twinkle protein